MELRTAVLLVFVLLPPESSSFIQKKETVCHSDPPSSCAGHVQLTCNSGQRLAVLGVSRAYLNISTFEQCPSILQNCSAIPGEGCCQSLKPPLVCEEDYSLDFLEEAYVNCSGQLPSVGQENVSCVLDLPPGPLPARGRCRQSAYRSPASYSVVDYACVHESDVAQFCNASRRTGNLVYTTWTVGDWPPHHNDVNVTSCRCSVTADPSSPSRDVFVRVLDVRIPRSDVREDCSHVTIKDGVRTRLNTTCLNKTTILFKGSSSQPLSGVTASRLPVDVVLSLSPKSAPPVVWIGFKGLDSHDLTLTCFDAGQNLSQEVTQTQDLFNTDSRDSPPPIPVVIGGSVAGVVFIVIVVFICFHFFGKKKQSSQNYRPSSWWERTRQEDRLAHMSQLGPPSSVNVDRGVHMGYGKEPPTRRYFPTSDTNPPIYFVSGHAVPREHSDSVDDPHDGMGGPHGVAGSRRSSGVVGERPGATSRRASGAVPNLPVWSGGRREPGVRYSVSTDGKDPQSVVIVDDGAKVRAYEIPPLTVTEIDE